MNLTAGTGFTDVAESTEDDVVEKPSDWKRVTQPRPASEYEIRCGSGVIKAESATWPSYMAVTTTSAYEAVRPHLTRQPSYVAYPRSKDFKHLDSLGDAVPNDVEVVVGIGGGSALDASKYIAIKRGLPLILVPTIISTLAIVRGRFPVYDGRNPVDWHWDQPWIDCEYVLVDHTVVLQAADNLNTAGLGDILCDYAGLSEWRHNASMGNGPPWDETTALPAIRHHEHIVREFPGTTDDQGTLSVDSIQFAVSALKARDDYAVDNPATWSGEHALAEATELINDKSWVHGELVALNAVIIAWKCGQMPEKFASGLDRCRVRWRPTSIGISHGELSRGLDFVPQYMADQASGRDLTSIIRREPVRAQVFEDLWNFLESA